MDNYESKFEVMVLTVWFLNIKPLSFFKILYLLSTHQIISIKDNDIY